MKKGELKRVIVAGASGRMGFEVIGEIRSRFPKCEVIGHDKVKTADVDSWSEDTDNADVLVDFSSQKAFSSVLKFSKKMSLPLVSGTTGLTPSQVRAMKLAAREIPVMWSANMSVGVTILKKMAPLLCGLEDADIFIEDYHHSKKQDAPSGTAKILLEEVKKTTNNKTKKKIEVSSHRAGGIYGVHHVHAVSPNEWIKISHTALNRRVFAQGAIRAAVWLKSQQPGLYSLDDVVGV